MFLLLKLQALYDSLEALVDQFPDVKIDVTGLFTLVSTSLLTKSFTLQTFTQVASAAQKLIVDFVTDFDGSQTQLAAFEAAFAKLFQ